MATAAFQTNAFQNNAFQVGEAPIVIDDTHDGDRHKKRLKRYRDEERRREINRENIIAAYERIVEGKPEIAKEIAKDFAVVAKAAEKQTPKIDFDRLYNDLDRSERLWREYLEMDDDEILVLM